MSYLKDYFITKINYDTAELNYIFSFNSDNLIIKIQFYNKLLKNISK